LGIASKTGGGSGGGGGGGGGSIFSLTGTATFETSFSLNSIYIFF
jgi:hypothetical protein